MPRDTGRTPKNQVRRYAPILTLRILSPLFSNPLAFQRTDSLVGVCTHSSERNLFSFHSTLMDFHHSGLIGKVRTKRIHPGSSQVHRHTSGPLPRPLQTTPPCLGTAQLNFTFLFGFLPKFNRFSRFILRCKAEIQAPHLMSITHAPCQREIPWHAHQQKEVMNKNSRYLWLVISVFI